MKTWMLIGVASCNLCLGNVVIGLSLLALAGVVAVGSRLVKHEDADEA